MVRLVIRTMVLAAVVFISQLGQLRPATAFETACPSVGPVPARPESNPLTIYLDLSNDEPVCGKDGSLPNFALVVSDYGFFVHQLSFYAIENGQKTLFTPNITSSSDSDSLCGLSSGGVFSRGGACDIEASGTFRGRPAKIRVRTTFQISLLPTGDTYRFFISASFEYSSSTQSDKRSVAVRQFLARRADQIVSQSPDLSDRLNAPVGGSAPGSINGDANRFAFAISVNQAMALGRRAAIAPDGSAAKAKAATSDRKTGDIDVWIKGSGSRGKVGDSESSMTLFQGGTDIVIQRGLVAGVMVQFDRYSETDPTLASYGQGDGWMTGPYLVARLGRNLVADVKALGGRASNDLTIDGLTTGSFGSNRWMVQGQLTGRFDYDRWIIKPRANLLYFHEEAGSFDDKAGFHIDAQKINIGRVSLGPEIGTNVDLTSGVRVEPFVQVLGIWDFRAAGAVQFDNGVLESTPEVRARVAAGGGLHLSHGWMLRGQGFVDGIGAANFKAYGGNVTLVMPLN